MPELSPEEIEAARRAFLEAAGAFDVESDKAWWAALTAALAAAPPSREEEAMRLLDEACAVVDALCTGGTPAVAVSWGVRTRAFLSTQGADE